MDTRLFVKPNRQGFVVRALNDGGLVFEKEGCRTLGEALAALEDGLANWFKEND